MTSSTDYLANGERDMNFLKPEHCKLNRDRLAELGRLPKKERGERQVICMTCGRWCYESDRCNLFVPALGKGPAT